MAVKSPIRNERRAPSGMLLRFLKHLPLIMMISPAMTAGAVADCELHEPRSRATSPDGKWVATFFDNVCGAGFVTIVFSSVELAPANEMNSRNPSTPNVFEMDDFADPKIAAVTWTGPRALQITVPNNAWIDEQESTFAGVTISYKYVPDDPIERARINRLYCSSIKETYEKQHEEPTPAYIARCGAEGGPKTSPQ
jgi:hypothetical protein